MREFYKKTISYFFLILFLGYYVSTFSFTHTHIVNGITIVHSHPYNLSSEAKSINHQHSEKEFALIYTLSHFLTTVPAFIISIKAYKFILKKYNLKKDNKSYSAFFFSSNGLRAPPIH
ncbi:MAG: hypothetical protein GX259_00395 [Bacteroidales bacterium]|nr:hypothetical protein [Bacteroidales bacterium]